jgi:PAS domain S-box-containing protein
MTTATPTRDDVLEEVDALCPPGTPVTTPEVAEEFDCTKRTIYNRLDALVEDGRLQTKKVGASSRVWWRPVDMAPHYCETMSGREQVRAHPVFDSELVGVIVWGADPTSNDAADLVIEDANDAFLEMAGLEYEDALDTSWRELTPETYYSDSERNTESVEATGSGAPYEKQYYHADDSRWWGLFELQPLNDDKFVEFVVDVTEREQAQQELREMTAALERLTEAGQELIDATPETIRDRTADVVLSVLDVEYAALRRYDETAGELDAHASESFSDVVADGIRLPRDLSDQAWQTFISDTVDVDNDIDIPEDDADDRGESSSVRSRMLVPLGRHGVICAASTQANAFDDQTIDLAETVATTVETAWDRAESEQELAQQNEEFIHLDRLNTLLRGVDQALVTTETVERIDDAVCERIAESELYEFAWIGDYDAETGGVEPRAWAGVDSAYLDDFETRGSDPSVDESPFTTALRTGELQVIADVATDPRAVPWREETLERGGRSCLCIPLTYDDSVYGVLAVYGGTPHQEARDTEVLAELGRTIGHAIHAVETRDSLRTDTAYELTLESSDAETPLCRLSRTSGCVIEFEGQVPGADGLTTVFFTASGIDPDEFVAASEGSIAIDDLTRLDERDDGVLYKVRLVEPTLAGLFIEEGASVHSLSIDAGTATAVLDLPDTTEVSTFLTAVRTSVPDLELLTRRSRTRSLETDLTLRTTFEERLTPRQREVLQLAYQSGFFESPRLQTGKELAEALSLAQSTFNYHLRGAQRTLLELLFEPAEATN